MSDTVVLLHGIFRTKRCMASLARILRTHGYNVLNLGYPSTRFTLEELATRIHPSIQHAAMHAGKVHFIGYSMGGLLVRAYLAAYPLTNLGKVVMLGTPNHGSEVADYLKDWKLYRWLYGPAGQQLMTQTPCTYIMPSCAVGIIAGSRSYDPLFGRHMQGAHDGKVSVESTKMDGMADHIVLPVCHTLMPKSRRVHMQVLAFLRDGAFER